MYSYVFYRCTVNSTSYSAWQIIKHINSYSRLELPKAAFAVLHGCYRQSWYLTPQLVILALADEEGGKEEREDLAKSLHSCPRVATSLLKPVFPTLVWSADSRPPPLSSLVTPDSWTLFDRLALEGPNVRSICLLVFAVDN